MTTHRAIWRPAYIALGSNLDDPMAQVKGGFDDLGRIPATSFVVRSSLYRTAPMGPADQPDFVNAVAAVLTRLDPRELLQALKTIEDAHGRHRDTRRWGARTLDLDLLLAGSLQIDEPDLQVPHPGIAERNFVLLPLAEIAPHVWIPGCGSVQKVLAGLTASGDASARIERVE